MRVLACGAVYRKKGGVAFSQAFGATPTVCVHPQFLIPPENGGTYCHHKLGGPCRPRMFDRPATQVVPTMSCDSSVLSAYQATRAEFAKTPRSRNRID